MNNSKMLIFLTVLLAIAFLPSTFAQFGSISDDWNLNTGSTPAPSPTPTASTSPAPNETTTPTDQPNTQPTIQPTENPTFTEQPTPSATPTVSEFNPLIIVVLMIICGLGVVLAVYSLKGGAGQ